MKRIVIVVFIFFAQFTASGQAIEDISLPNVVDGNTYALSKLKNQRAVVVVFYSGKCAYGNYYLERILLLEGKFSRKGIKFLLVNSNSSAYVPEETLTAMKKFTEEHNISFPYLADKEKILKNSLQSTRTPEVFVLTPNQSSLQVVYKGAIDDNPQSASDVNHAYLEEVLVNLLANKKIEVNQTRPVGCLIK